MSKDIGEILHSPSTALMTLVDCDHQNDFEKVCEYLSDHAMEVRFLVLEKGGMTLEVSPSGGACPCLRLFTHEIYILRIYIYLYIYSLYYNSVLSCSR